MCDEALRAAEAMRQYIVRHLAEDLTPAQVTNATGYSLRHGGRLFGQATGKSLGEYIRLLRLSAAAQTLAQNGKSPVLEVALDHYYQSHEGFTKAFSSAFGITPTAYRKGGRPIQYFIPYPVSLPDSMFRRKDTAMNPVVTATIVQKPARKLVMLHSKTGTDYWSFCQEQGCDWEGLLLSIPARLDLPAFISLPPGMTPPGCAEGAVAVEVPADYTGGVPDGYVLADLPAGEMLYFQSPPYADEECFPEAIKLVFDAYESYSPDTYGFVFDTQTLPVFNFGAFADKGARIAILVKKK
ncbi:MAG: helix-turn-helix transcriptional regulator [Ruminococcaceae bacterium]|nr:helix-turn-helix transcriptional regulator [Oscillospiraceae bacterium]